MAGDPMTVQTEAPPSSPAILDRPLQALGFEFVVISPGRVTGRLKVTETCCQPFGVLHGGVSATMAEGVASMGAYVASGFQRVAGVQLSINHVRAALLGDLVEAEAQPVQVGKNIQVWEVKLWRIDPSNKRNEELISVSKLTLLCNMQATESTDSHKENVRKFAKL